METITMRYCIPVRTLVIALTVLVLISLMCGCISSPESETDEGTDKAVLPTPTVTPYPQEPTATPPQKAQSLNVVEHMFAQTGTGRVAYAFIIENPNKNLTLERNRYHVVVYDEAGTQLGKNFGTIAVVLPGERQYVTKSGIMLVSDKAKIAKLEVQIEPGEAKVFESTSNPFTVEQVECFRGPYEYIEYIVTGVIKNSLDKTLKNVQVAAIAYDASGAFICSGTESIDFIPANGQTAVKVRLETTEEPVKVELYPTLSDLSVFEEATISLETFEPEEIWFMQDDSGVSFAFTFDNPDKTHSLEGTVCQVAAYDEAGTVQGTYSHHFPIIYPSQRLGVLGGIWDLPEGTNIAKLDIQISPGELKSSELTESPFSTEQVTYVRGLRQSKVTGIIKSSLELDVTNIMVTAIAYDDSGTIIGGGEGIVDFILANGHAAASVNVDTTEEPAKVELYPGLCTLSKYKEVSAEGATLNVVATGFSQETWFSGDRTGRIWLAFIVENSNTTHAFGHTDYQAAAYDEAGTVLGTTSYSIAIVFPGERLGKGRWIIVPETKEVAKLEVQIRPEQAKVFELTRNPFTAEQVKYVPDEHFPKVTGLIKSSWEKEARVTFTAIAYDDSGAIIGGGFDNGFAEAYGQGVVGVNVDTTGQPAKVELYPSFLSPPYSFLIPPDNIVNL